MTATINLPDPSSHIAIIGRNGSGKTQAAAWHLSLTDYDRRPWIIFNTKGDDLIDEIPGTQELRINQDPPKKPGLYIVRPLPHQEEERDNFLWKAWRNKNTGLWLDEGYMFQKSKPFEAILTQGRSKRVSCIILTQRPVFVTRFVWSEANFFQVFHLQNVQDKKVVREFVPMPSDNDVPQYWSVYYDVKANRTILLRPVPDRATILTNFRDRLRVRRKAI